MRSLPSGWNTVLTKLGFIRRKRKKGGRTSPFSRRLGMESLEQRRVLASVTVSNDTDVVDAPDLSSISALIADPGTDEGISLREAITAANAASRGGGIYEKLVGGHVLVLAYFLLLWRFHESSAIMEKRT